MTAQRRFSSFIFVFRTAHNVFTLIFMKSMKNELVWARFMAYQLINKNKISKVTSILAKEVVWAPRLMFFIFFSKSYVSNSDFRLHGNFLTFHRTLKIWARR